MYDTIIIGSGPAGLSAAVYASRSGLKMLLLEAQFEGSGQIAQSGRVDNYLGLPGISGYDMGEKFREHALALGADIIRETAKAIEKTDDFYTVTGKKGKIYQARSIIYAAGTRPRTTGLPSEQRLVSAGICYCAQCDGAFYKGLPVAVLGGGDTALDDALYLAGICSKVYLIHRRDQFRGAPVTLSKLKEVSNVEFILGAEVAEFTGSDQLTGIRLNDGREIEVSGAFVAYGSLPQTDLAKDLVLCDKAGYIIAGEDGITYGHEASQKEDTFNGLKAISTKEYDILPGFFAAGDVRTKHLRQVVTAVADGACAATSAAEYIRQFR